MQQSTLQDTPRGSRLHIGLYGRTNSGKSSLLNGLTGQRAAMVSPVCGTTTDPVYKAMELHGFGPCMFIDTPGFDDRSVLGAMRIAETEKALDKTDIALLLLNGQELAQKGTLAQQLSLESHWLAAMEKRKLPFLLIVSQRDCLTEEEEHSLTPQLEDFFGKAPLFVSVQQPDTLEKLRQELLRSIPEDFEKNSITGILANPGDLVLLVMPQDIQAPKGRLILPQVQTIRDLLDKKCIAVSCTADTLDITLQALERSPDLIVTDSQIFPLVFKKKPETSKLTSFSILFADYKGDLRYYAQSAAALDQLTEKSRVLIAEACTHAPLTEDIGREKIPAMLRKKTGPKLHIDFVRGTDFPQDLSGYDLVIQCGACMFNRRYVLSRIEKAKEQQVPMTNYGVAIAHLTGILKHLKLQ